MNPEKFTVGILGGGQLGRMSVLAGRRLGMSFVVFEPSGGACATKVADTSYGYGYDELDGLRDFAAQVDVATYEFENVPADAAAAVAEIVPLRPNARTLSVCQHRLREKTFLKESRIPHAPFAVAERAQDLQAAIDSLGGPCVVKTAAFGYDGKGQVKVDDPLNVDVQALWSTLKDPPGVVVERWIEHQGEVSVIVARDTSDKSACFEMAENVHRNHILHMSIVPARVSEQIRARGIELAIEIAEALDVVGLIAVEMFITEDGLLVNEMAPRPHNSGHYTLDACATSQFEQHVRAVAGLPLGAPNLLRPAVMVNLLGDLWNNGTPDFEGLLADPTVSLHLYDKGAARPGRKMGHFTVLDLDVEAAVARAEAAFTALEAAS